jgi:hypothetical protein
VFHDGTMVRTVLGKKSADRPNEQTDWSERINPVRQVRME